MLDKRRIEVPKRKTRWPNGDQARTVVLSFMARWYLARVALSLQKADRFDANDRLFPMTNWDFLDIWPDIVNRACVNDLRVDDLRREASSRFFEAGLARQEHNIMLGCCDRILPSPQSDLESIQDKLDRHVLGGRTFEEAKNEIPLIDPTKIIEVREWMARRGIIEIEKPGPGVILHFPVIALDKLAY